MKYTKSALGMLNSLYRSVLTKCMLINLGLFALAAPAIATEITTTGGTDSLGDAFTSQPTVNVTGLAISDVNELQNKLNGKLGTGLGNINDAGIAKITGYANDAIAASVADTTTAGALGTLLGAKADSADLEALAAIVGDDNSGLVKGVADNKAAIATLNGTGDGSVAKAVADAIDGLDADVSQAAGTDGLSLRIVEENGVITSISGAIAEETYDDYGAAEQALNDAKAYTDGKLTDGSVDAKFNSLQATEVKVGEGTTAVKLSQEADGLHINADLNTSNHSIVTTSGDITSTSGNISTANGTVSGKTLQGTTLEIGGANSISGSAGTLDMNGNSLKNISDIASTALTTNDDSKLALLGHDGYETDLIGEEIVIRANDSATVSAGDNFMYVDAEDGIGIEGKTSITGDTSVIGSFDVTAGDVEFEVTEDGITLTGDTAIDGSLTIGTDSVLETTEIDGHKVLQVSVAGDETALYVKDTMVRTNDSLVVEGDDGNERFIADADGMEIKNADDDKVFEIDSEDGSFMAAGEKFVVDENGAISAVDGKFIATDEGIGLFTNSGDTDNTFSVAADDGSIYAASGNFQVDEDGDITSKGTLSVSDGKFEVDEDGAFRASDNKFFVDSDGAMSASDGKFSADVDGNIYAAGDADIDGDLNVGDYFSVKAEDGSFSAADGKFAVNENGSIAAADNKFVVNKDGNITKAGTISAADGTFLVKEGGEVSAAAGTFQVKEGGVVSAAAGTFQVKEGGLVSAAAGTFLVKENGNVSASSGKFEIKDGGAVTAAGGDFMIDEDGNTLAESLAFNSDPDVFVNAIDQAEAAIVDGEVNEERLQTMATNATIAKTIGDLTSLTDEPAGVTDTTDVASAILTLSTNVEAATGGEFDDEGKWAATVDNSDDSNGYEYTESENIMDAINQVAANVGTADQLSNLFNGVEVANSVNSNINALNGKVGDVSTLNTELKNLTNGGDTAPETVVEALNNLDATLGRVHGLIESEDATTTVNGDAYAGNLAVGTDSTVESHLLALDGSIGDRRNMTSANAQINEASKESVVAGLNAAGNAIGDMDFSSSHYYKASGADANLSEAVRKLDNNIYRIDNDVRDLRRDFRRGMASMAAMTALVPNSRSLGDTSLSLGTGAYDGHTAMAVGGFHYLTDNLLLNAGAAWGNSNDMSYRLGVTYSF